MNTIIPCFWFDNQAEEAAQWYVSLFPNSALGKKTTYTEAGQEFHKQKPGSLMTIEFALSGVPFLGLNAGPVFTFNPSVSFFIECATKEEAANYWKKMSPNGSILMEFDTYPFSEAYGWIQDKYGISWQIIFVKEKKTEKNIIPSLLFTKNVCGKAKEAIDLYTSLFHNSQIETIMHYAKGQEPDTENMISYSRFFLDTQPFSAMESALDHAFSFNEAISFMIECENQEEIDYFWNGLLLQGGEEQQCGWLKDKFGVSWQVVPKHMSEFFETHDTQAINRSMNALMSMKKIIIKDLLIE